jgi:prevent-host-death family protein
MQISLTELRRTPGPALDHVRSGNEVVITEDGIPLGRIVPVGRSSRYAELMASGVIRPPVASGSPLEMRAFSVAKIGQPNAIPPASKLGTKK